MEIAQLLTEVHHTGFQPGAYFFAAVRLRAVSISSSCQSEHFALKAVFGNVLKYEGTFLGSSRSSKDAAGAPVVLNRTCFCPARLRFLRSQSLPLTCLESTVRGSQNPGEMPFMMTLCFA